MIESIALNKLRLSDRNVRKTNRNEGIEGLAEDIASRGLKQNLVVTASREKPGLFEVDAGGRRFLALQLLSSQKRIPKNHPVPCLIEAWEQAHETSLAENLHRVAMNPADEFQAFATVIADYADSGITTESERVANCAKRFGVSIRHVEQRLRLAALAPEIFAALREGRISIDAAKAYAAHPDHKLQLKIFEAEEKKGSWGHSPKAIRDAVEGKVYLPDNPAVRYVGIEAYLAAGGRVEPDLFLGTEDRDVLLDPSIVDRLAKAKAAAEAEERARAEGWQGGVVKDWKAPGWQEPSPPADYRREYAPVDQLSEQDRSWAIRVFRIADAGALEATSVFFVPRGQEEAPRVPYTPETPEQRAQRERLRMVETIAVRLAAPKVEGTPLEGRTFWPRREATWIEAREKAENGDVIVALLVRIPADDVAAALPAAEEQFAREEAELAEEDAATAEEPAKEMALAGEDA